MTTKLHDDIALLAIKQDVINFMVYADKNIMGFNWAYFLEKPWKWEEEYIDWLNSR